LIRSLGNEKIKGEVERNRDHHLEVFTKLLEKSKKGGKRGNAYGAAPEQENKNKSRKKEIATANKDQKTPGGWGWRMKRKEGKKEILMTPVISRTGNRQGYRRKKKNRVKGGKREELEFPR